MGDQKKLVDLEMDLIVNPKKEPETLDLEINLLSEEITETKTIDLGIDLETSPTVLDMELDLVNEMEVTPSKYLEGDSGVKVLDLELDTLTEEELNADEDLMSRYREVSAVNVDPFEVLFNDYESNMGLFELDLDEIPVVEEDVAHKEEDSKLPPQEYTIELIKSLVKFRDQKVLSGDITTIDLADTTSKYILSILDQHPFTLAQAAKLSTLLYECAHNNRFDRDYILNAVKGVPGTSKETMRTIAFSLTSLYERTVSYYKSVKEKVDKLNEPKENISKEFYEEVVSFIRAASSYLDNNKDNIVYTKLIKFSVENGFSYECGKCGKEFRFNKSPFTLLAYTVFDKVKLIQKPIICTQCASLNIIRKSLFETLEGTVKGVYKSYADRWSSKERLSSIVNYFIYDMSSKLYSEGTKLAEIDLTVRTGQEEESYDSLRLRMISMYRDSDRVVKHMDKVSLVEEDVIEDIASLEDKYISYGKTFRNLAKYMCLLSNHSYSDVISQAKGSLYTYMSETPEIFRIVSDHHPVALSLYESRLLLGMNDVDDDTKLRVLSQFGFTSLDDIPKAMVEFEKIKEMFESDLEARAEFLSSLDQMTRFFMFLPVRTFTYSHEFIKLNASPIFTSWVNMVAELMVITHLSENIVNVWLPSGTYKNRSFFNKFDISKYVKGLVKDGFGTSSELTDHLVSLHVFTKSNHLFKEGINLKTSVSRGDKFSFLHKMNFLTNVTYEVYSELFEKLKGFQAEAYRMSARIKWSTYDFYNYYYGDQFTKEEIEAGRFELSSAKIAPKFEVVRENGERFSDFVQRVRNINNKGIGVPSKYLNFVNGEWKIPVYLSAITALSSFNSQTTKFDYLSVMCEMLYYVGTRTPRNLFRYLGLPNPSKAMLDSIEELSETNVDIASEFQKTVFLNAIYKDEYINVYRDSFNDDSSKYFNLLEAYDEGSLVEDLSYSSELGGRLGIDTPIST